MNTPKRQLLAMLSGDVAGYSRLMAADEEATIKTLAAHRDVISITVVSHHGRLVDFTGDNFLAEFGSAVDAIHCAAQIQHAIHTRSVDVPAERRMNFRLGAHLGEVRIEGDRIYGDAVNVASRLEGLSEVGGICLSKQMVDQVAGQFELGFEDLGERALKNIATPVHAFSVPAEALSVGPMRGGNNDGDRAATESARGIPTIAVLPFANLSNDPEQAHLVDAMTVDIITGLSCDRRLSVIAYNSVKSFKDTDPDLKAIGRMLGVRYIVAGTVRYLGLRIRVSTALIDAETSREIWGSNIDRAAAELFDIFDELIEAIVTALASTLRQTEIERFRRKPPEQLDAWALATRAHAARGVSTMDECLSMARRAVEIDPKYAYAWAVLGFLTAFKFPMGVSKDHPTDIEDSLAQTEKALSLDTFDPWNLVAKSVALQYGGRPTESLSYLQQSLRLNPSDVLAHLYYGRGLVFSGKPELAIAHFERFRRLNPNDPGAHMAGMYHAIGLSFLQRWEDAEQVARQSLAECGGRNTWSWAFLAIALGGQQRFDDAAGAIAELLKLSPHWTRGFVENFLKECQEDKALLVTLLEILRSVWP